MKNVHNRAENKLEKDGDVSLAWGKPLDITNVRPSPRESGGVDQVGYF